MSAALQILLHQHSVRCISFIWRDPTDARAFGYITALTADTKKQFFAIKTEKTVRMRAASQLVCTLASSRLIAIACPSPCPLHLLIVCMCSMQSDLVINSLKEMFQVIVERRKEVDEKKEREEREKEREKEREREKEKEKEKREEKKEEPKPEPPKEEKKVEENNLLDLIDVSQCSYSLC